MVNKENNLVLPWWKKYTLTLKDDDFVLWNGNRALIKRAQFEKYMDEKMNII